VKGPTPRHDYPTEAEVWAHRDRRGWRDWAAERGTLQPTMGGYFNRRGWKAEVVRGPARVCLHGRITHAPCVDCGTPRIPVDALDIQRRCGCQDVDDAVVLARKEREAHRARQAAQFAKIQPARRRTAREATDYLNGSLRVKED